MGDITLAFFVSGGDDDDDDDDDVESVRSLLSLFFSSSVMVYGKDVF